MFVLSELSVVNEDVWGAATVCGPTQCGLLCHCSNQKLSEITVDECCLCVIGKPNHSVSKFPAQTVALDMYNFEMSLNVDRHWKLCICSYWVALLACRLHHEIRHFYDAMSPTESERLARESLLERIRTVVTKLWSGAKVVVNVTAYRAAL